jgi:hypothetical protein
MVLTTFEYRIFSGPPLMTEVPDTLTLTCP